MNAQEIRTTLRHLGSRISVEFRAEIIGFFGSRARGDAAEESDLDVLVRFREAANLYDLIGLADLLEEVVGCKVDVVSVRALQKELEPEVFRDLIEV